MSASQTVYSVVVAGLALYGLGVPLAWLLPAPSESPWVYRIAIAPLYSIVVASSGAWVLLHAGVALHPGQLAALTVPAWALAGWRHGTEWRLREALAHAFGPSAMVVTAGVTWFFSLVGYGLYLPNRDFKNHAYFVAQIADLRSADYSMILRAAPLSPPNEGAFYPLGLHTLLGWALPTSSWPTLGVTAASAVLVVSISLPLACVALARQFMPGNSVLWVLCGFSVICFPAATSAFDIGSVVILAATALYAAALSCLWQWCQSPRVAESLALVLGGLGLFILHVSESWGLALVGIAALPTVRWSRAPRFGPVTVTALGLVLLVATAALAFPLRSRLASLGSDAWDIEPNIHGLPVATARALTHQPGGTPALALLWLALALTGVWLTRRRRLPAMPTIALLVPLGLAVLASARGIPMVLEALTAPWYGSTSRVFRMAVPAIALLGCLPLVGLLGPAGQQEGRRAPARRVLAFVAVVSLLAGLGSQLVPQRRAALAATLAGAGDTGAVGSDLMEAIEPGETVLNGEGDGTANLFAASRVPVLAGQYAGDGPFPGRAKYDLALGGLMTVSDPEVRAALADLGVRYIAIGASSLYWDQQVGYSVEELVRQPELSVFRTGTDMTILRYMGTPR